MSHKNWQYDELILAFNLYCKLPFGQYHQRNPQVVELAGLLVRSPSAVAMKLGNFASLDPYHKARGVQGLANASEADRLVWREFHDNWERLGIESEARLAQLTKRTEQLPLDRPADAFCGPTGAERLLKVRLGQQFFRAMTLTGYRCRCCVCDIPVRQLFVASRYLRKAGKRLDWAYAASRK